ncbi:MAG: hypothetical protein AAF638_06765 [Pseudomonadota bacterium]
MTTRRSKPPDRTPPEQFSDMLPGAAASYIADLVGPLCSVARANNLLTLAYLLQLAREEAVQLTASAEDTEPEPE